MAEAYPSMLLPLQGASLFAPYTQGVDLGYELMPLRGASTHLTEEPFYVFVKVLQHSAEDVYKG